MTSEKWIRNLLNTHKRRKERLEIKVYLFLVPGRAFQKADAEETKRYRQKGKQNTTFGWNN